MEAFAPFTVVNGKVWPVLDVQPATYRLRVLNGSNARTFRLVLLRDGAPELERITQIGTDHGLLRSAGRACRRTGSCSPRPSAPTCSSTSPTSRPGSELTLLNTAAAPFDGTRSRPRDAESAADLEGCCPIRTSCASASWRAPTSPRRSRASSRPTSRLRRRDALAGAPRRAIALVERELDDEPNMLTMRELAVADDDHDAAR